MMSRLHFLTRPYAGLHAGLSHCLFNEGESEGGGLVKQKVGDS